MNEIIVIEGTKLEKIEYRGEVVVSLPMVDAVHKRPEGTARRTFNKFRDKFIVGEDYFSVPHEEWTGLTVRNTSDQRGYASDQKGGRRGNMNFLTLSGYMMLVKTFTDDLSWRIQRMLVKSYFKATQTVDELKDELIDMQRRLILALTRKTNKVSPEEVAQMVAYKRRGMQTHEIRDRLGRSSTTVKTHIAKARKLGLFDDAEAARA